MCIYIYTYVIYSDMCSLAKIGSTFECVIPRIQYLKWSKNPAFSGAPAAEPQEPQELDLYGSIHCDENSSLISWNIWTVYG